MKKRILIADSIAADGVAYLESQPDFEVTTKTGMSEDNLCREIGAFDAVIVRSATQITAKVLESAAKLSVVGRAGIGVDNIDVPVATARGVVVVNTPDANATTTAELTIAHLLSLSRLLPMADRSVRAGGWERSTFTGVEVAGKTLGIVGYGTIGRLVAARARALQMSLLVFDPFVTSEVIESGGGTAADLVTLLRESDYVTLHCPVTEKTRGMIGKEQLAMMKKGARLINCARGALVDEPALVGALQSGHLAGAALDVYVNEPPTGSPLLALPNVVFTPHLGASTREAQAAAGIQIARQVATFLKTGEPINAVNLSPVSREQLVLLKPFQVLARALGRLLVVLAAEPLKQIDVILAGGPAEVEVGHVATEALIGLLADHCTGPVNQVNAGHLAKRQGLTVVESRSNDTGEYRTLLQLIGRTAKGKVSVAGTLFDERLPRLVRIDDFEIEAILEGHLLLTRHQDRPGVVAGLSRVIAEAGVNITRMHLGPVGDQELAVAVIGLDNPLSKQSLDAVTGLGTVLAVHQLAL